jgi:hypothetical protein
MFGASIALNHQVSQARCRDYLAEAERQRSFDIALAGHARRARFAGVRASIASGLLRAGSWLMPEEAPNGCSNPANCAFELRPGQ